MAQPHTMEKGCKQHVLVTGATGFVGSHVIRHLLAHGHRVTACVRHVAAARGLFPEAGAVPCDFTRDLRTEDWLPRLVGIDAVVNAVGIIRELRGQPYAALHTQAPAALFAACEKAGVRRVVQISALGADRGATAPYHTSKRAADDVLADLDLDWVILRPSIVYGPGGKSTEFFLATAAQPVVALVGDGRQRIQPVFVGDLAQAVCAALENGAAVHERVDVVGPHPVTMGELTVRLRRWLGLRAAPVIRVPLALTMAAGTVSGWLGSLPLTRETITMLGRDNTGDVARFTALTGVRPRPMEAWLHDNPATTADLWHARLFFLAPLLRAAIGSLWIWLGLVSLFFYPRAGSDGLLARVGVSEALAPFALYGAAMLDVALGVATLANVRIRLVGAVQILLILGYSAFITFGLPNLWLHPFGPVAKNVPLIVATLIMMVLSGRR